MRKPPVDILFKHTIYLFIYFLLLFLLNVIKVRNGIDVCVGKCFLNSLKSLLSFVIGHARAPSVMAESDGILLISLRGFSRTKSYFDVRKGIR